MNQSLNLKVRSEIKQVSDKLTAEIKQVSDRLSSFEKSVEHRLTKADNGDQLDALRAEMHEGFNNLRQHILIEKLDRIDHKLPNLTKEEEKKNEKNRYLYPSYHFIFIGVFI